MPEMPSGEHPEIPITEAKLMSKKTIPVKIPKKLMVKAMAMESEHSKSKRVQRKIVSEHVAVYGPKYYIELSKMEKRLRRLKK